MTRDSGRGCTIPQGRAYNMFIEDRRDPTRLSVSAVIIPGPNSSIFMIVNESGKKGAVIMWDDEPLS